MKPTGKATASRQCNCWARRCPFSEKKHYPGAERVKRWTTCKITGKCSAAIWTMAGLRSTTISLRMRFGPPPLEKKLVIYRPSQGGLEECGDLLHHRRLPEARDRTIRLSDRRAETAAGDEDHRDRRARSGELEAGRANNVVAFLTVDRESSRPILSIGSLPNPLPRNSIEDR